jgi:hypothetical protein
VGWEGEAAGTDRAPRRERHFCRGKNNAQTSDELMLVYLVELDGGAPPVDPRGIARPRSQAIALE